MGEDKPGVRLAELIASLSLATDLGLGLPEEHVLRQTIIATRLAELAGVDERERAAIFYVSLLAWVGCIADSPEMGRWFVDDLKLRADSATIDKVGMPMMRFLFDHIGTGAPTFRRITLVGRFFAGGFRDAMTSFVTHCQTTGHIADRLGLEDDVRHGLDQTFERWDGKGVPDGLAGEQIDRVTRIVQIADDSEVFDRMGGAQAVREMLMSRRGTEFDPTLVDLFCANAESILEALDDVEAWSFVIDNCPGLEMQLGDVELTATLETFADYADLKSTWFLGHSRAVSDLASAAGRACGLSTADVTALGRAALVHRIGMIGVPAGIWDKNGSLSRMEQERVRTVPYLTERVLARQPRLAELGAIACMSHERMDGSGYPRGLSGAAIPPAARILAAADVYQALVSARPHRPALSREQCEATMLDEVRTGRLDDSAARAVLAAAGHTPPRRANLVAGLTTREAEILGLVARGWSNKQIAAELSITPRTVGSHIEHAYTKIGVNTRGAAAMFAMQHGLIDLAATAAPSVAR